MTAPRALCALFSRPFGAVLGFAALALALAPVAGASDEPLDGAAIFAHAKSVFRSHERPEFVVYTLDRVETVDEETQPEDSYRLRIWYRTADRSALIRHMKGAHAVGPLEFARIAFNQPIDPGPPTTDIFEPVPPRGQPLPSPLPTGDLRTIQSVRVTGELDYRVVNAAREDDAFHLWLAPRRDPERNRLRELWVDAKSYEVRRAIATDRLYFTDEANYWIPDSFDMTLAPLNDVPAIRRIQATTEVDAATRAYGPHERSDYHFEDIAFPETLPSWYFHPETYGAHVSEAPDY